MINNKYICIYLYVLVLLSEPIKYFILLFVPIIDYCDEFVLPDIQIKKIHENILLRIGAQERVYQPLDQRLR